MRGAPKSTLTADERRAKYLAASRRWQDQRAVANLALGLRTDGKERKHKSSQVSPRIRRLLAQYLRRQEQTRRDMEQAKLSPLEQAWRSERASMGVIEVPEIKLYTAGRTDSES